MVRVRRNRDGTGPSGSPGPSLLELPGSEAVLPCELVLLAMGFIGDDTCPIAKDLALPLDVRGVFRADAAGRTALPGVFVAGDCYRGASLVVWAIADGRRAAQACTQFLSEKSGPAAVLGAVTPPRP